MLTFNRFLFPAVLAALIGAPCIASAGNEATEPLVIEFKMPEVAAVASNAELHKQPTMKAGGIPVKLGLESLKVPANSAVMAYCLWTPEKDRTYTVAGPLIGAPLGPLLVRVAKQGVRNSTGMVRSAVTFSTEGEQIQVCALRVQDPGKYDVEFLSLDGTLVAQATLEAVDNSNPTWRQLKTTAEDRTDKPAGIAATVTIGTTSINPKVGIQTSIKADAALPTFAPKEADDTFKASYADGTISIATKGPISLSSAGSQLLVRYWINGKPAAAEDQGTRTMAQSKGVARMEGDVKISLKLADVAKELNAKPGDKIVMEVLFSQAGWEFARMTSYSRIAVAPVNVEEPLMRLSNKVEFDIPGK